MEVGKMKLAAVVWCAALVATVAGGSGRSQDRPPQEEKKATTAQEKQEKPKATALAPAEKAEEKNAKIAGPPETKYVATAESLKKHPLPEWYTDAKLGIFIHWGLYSVPGWAVPTPEGLAGHYFSGHSFGHTGFTGTSIWVDPDRQLFVVFLTNRVHPTRENQKIQQVRRDLHDAVMQDRRRRNHGDVRNRLIL